MASFMDRMLWAPGEIPLEKTKLKIPPKVCSICGGKYIPVRKNQSICQVCEDRPKEKPLTKREKDMLAAFGRTGREEGENHEG